MKRLFLLLFTSLFFLVGNVFAVPGDLDNDGCISFSEVSAFIVRWFNGQVSFSDVNNAIIVWLNGGCVVSNVFMSGESLLGSQRAINWSPGIPGGIPYYNVSVNVMSYGAVGDGVADDTQAIKNAIAAAPARTAVYLPPGKYKVTSEIRFEKSIAIRGAGPEQTKIVCNFGGTCLSPFKYGAASSFTQVTSGYNRGSKEVTVSNPNLFVVGQYFNIQQSFNDPAVFSCGELGCDPGNVTGQVVKIIAKNGSKIILEKPLYYDYNPNMGIIARNLDLQVGVGVEDLAIVRTANITSGGANIHFGYAANCWVKNVWSQYSYRSHVSMWYTYQCEIRDNVFNDAWVRGSGGQGYGVEILMKSSDNLVINNIFWKLRHAAIFAYGSAGNVVAYNYFKDNAGGDSGPHLNPGWLPPDCSIHGNYPTMNLFEGNVMNAFYADNAWGSNGPTVVFRNRILRQSYFVSNPGAINIFPYVWISLNNKYNSIIGNELGVYGQVMNGNGWTNIGNSATGSLLIVVDPEDPLVNATTLIHGNFEYLSNNNTAVLHLGWNPNLPQQLPASLFLTSKPDFFGSLDWPAFGPEKINSGNKIPAQIKYEQLAAQNKIGPNFTYILN